MMEFKKIVYKLDKSNSIRYCRISVDSVKDGAVYIVQTGKLGGAEQETITPVYPKNVGRANETTPIQQAILEARSHYAKLLDKGFKDLGPEEQVMEVPLSRLYEELEKRKGTDANGRPMAMLAQKPKYMKTRAVFPGYLQRKYNGIRALVRWEQGVPIMYSRRGKLFLNLEHILEELPPLPDGWVYDGELFSETLSLQQIVSYVKRAQPETIQVGYRIYDLAIKGVPFKKRYRNLIRLLKGVKVDFIRRAQTYKVKDMEKVIEYFKEFLREGYEGAMYRNPDGLYEFGERSYGLIKVKDILSEEFEIVGVTEATGRDKGTAVFILKTKKGVVFNSRPMGTWEQRHEYWVNREDYIGKMATVLFQEWTPKGKPFHSRVEVIRDYE